MMMERFHGMDKRPLAIERRPAAPYPAIEIQAASLYPDRPSATESSLMMG